MNIRKWKGYPAKEVKRKNEKFSSFVFGLAGNDSDTNHLVVLRNDPISKERLNSPVTPTWTCISITTDEMYDASFEFIV